MTDYAITLSPNTPLKVIESINLRKSEHCTLAPERLILRGCSGLYIGEYQIAFFFQGSGPQNSISLPKKYVHRVLNMEGWSNAETLAMINFKAINDDR